MTILRGKPGLPGACFVYRYQRGNESLSSVSTGVIYFNLGDTTCRINVEDIYGDDHSSFWTLMAANGGVISLKSQTGRLYTAVVTSGTVANGVATLNFSAPFEARLILAEVYIVAALNGARGESGQGGSGGSEITSSTETTLTGYLKGNGSNVSASASVPATDLTGTINDDRLSDNVPVLNNGELTVTRIATEVLDVGNNQTVGSVNVTGTIGGVLASLNPNRLLIANEGDQVEVSANEVELGGTEPGGQTTSITQRRMRISEGDSFVEINSDNITLLGDTSNIGPTDPAILIKGVDSNGVNIIDNIKLIPSGFDGNDYSTPMMTIEYEGSTATINQSGLSVSVQDEAFITLTPSSLEIGNVNTGVLTQITGTGISVSAGSQNKFQVISNGRFAHNGAISFNGPFGYIKNNAAAQTVLRVEGTSDQTGKIISLTKGNTEVAFFDNNGNLTCPEVEVSNGVGTSTLSVGSLTIQDAAGDSMLTLTDDGDSVLVVGSVAKPGSIQIDDGTSSIAVSSNQIIVNNGELSMSENSNDRFKITTNGRIHTNQTTNATTLGSVAKRMPIYSTTGDLMGYIPIYDTIT